MSESGMGNLHEQPYREQFRDSRTKRPTDIVYRPMPAGRLPAHLEDLRCLWEHMKIQQGLLLEDMFHKTVFFSKRPAYVEPPFFSVPTVKPFFVILAPSTTFTTLWTEQIPGRHALIVSGVGMDVGGTCPIPAQQQVCWRFRFGDVTVPLFNDNSVAPVGVESFEQGVFSLSLGTFDNPLPLYQLGVGTRLKAESSSIPFSLQAQNLGLTSVCIKVLTTWYTYRYDQNFEFEQAEYMQ